MPADSPDGMSEKDTVCYAKNYADVREASESRNHYTT